MPARKGKGEGWEGRDGGWDGQPLRRHGCGLEKGRGLGRWAGVGGSSSLNDPALV